MKFSREKIFTLVDRVLPDIVELRHTIHRQPELAGEEFKTASLVRDRLRTTSAKILPPFLQTDVVAIISGSTPGSNITLRADMDALPLEENSELPYKSEYPGKMHACGHDAHTAMLVGAGLVLDQLRDEFSGSVRLVFQPGEEIAALGRDLVAAGALKNPPPHEVYALHGMSGYEAGHIICKTGPIMAAAGFFKITVMGKGGHGSRPELCIDPIVIGSRIVDSLQSIVARRIAPQSAAVISVCRFTGGTNANIIPDRVEIEGTTRFLDPAVGELLPEMIENTAKGICLAAGAEYLWEYRLPYLPTINDVACVERAASVAASLFGSTAWHEMAQASMGGEDFSYYLQDYPGAMCKLGIGCDHPPIHSSNFDFNDEALRNGIAFFVALVLAANND